MKYLNILRSLSPQLIFCGMIILSAFVTFGPTLRVGFLWDDHEMIENNPTIRRISLNTLTHAFTTDVFDGKGDAYYRPLQTLMNMIDYQIWGLNPFGYHLTNLLFHALTACLIYGILILFLRPELALLGALGFVVHPVIVEQLLIIAGRAELMSLAFLCAALFIRLKTNLRYLWVIGVLYLMSMLSKESGVMFPAFLFSLRLVVPKLSWSKKELIFYGVMFFIYALLRLQAVTAPPLSLSGLGAFVVKDLPAIIVSYIHLILFPTDLHSHRRMMFSSTWMIWNPLLLVLLGFWIFRQRSRVMLFCCVWFLFGLAPKLPNFLSSSLMLDHWGYVGSLGVIVFILVQEKVPLWWRYVVFWCLFIFWILMSWFFISVRNTDEKMYRWALKFPTSSVVRYNLGVHLYRDGRDDEAQLLFEESLLINPSSVMTLNGLSMVSLRKGDINKALAYINHALSLDPDNEWLQKNKDLIEKRAKK